MGATTDVGARLDAPDELLERVCSALGPRRAVILATASPSGQPATTPLSWVATVDGRTIALALDRRGHAYENLRKNDRAALEVWGSSFAATLLGRVTFVADRLDAAPFDVAVVVLTVEEIRDHSPRGLVLSPFTLEYLPEKQHYGRGERTIVAELERLLARA